MHESCVSDIFREVCIRKVASREDVNCSRAAIRKCLITCHGHFASSYSKRDILESVSLKDACVCREIYAAKNAKREELKLCFSEGVTRFAAGDFTAQWRTF